MSFANSEPDLKTKKQLYELYINVFNSSISSLHKEKILGTIFSYEPWSWRVVGISKKALKEFKDNNYNYKSRTFNRDHYFQGQTVTLKKMLEKIMPFDEWWLWFWDNDKTLLITIPEHNKKSYDINKDIITIDWKLGYFKCHTRMGFICRKKDEGKFLEDLTFKFNIK